MRFLTDAMARLGGERAAKRGTRRRVAKAPDWRRRRQVGAGVLVAAVAVSGTWLWTSGWVARQIDHAEQATLRASARAGLKVEDVLVEGRVRTRRSAIVSALSVTRDAPILAFDPYGAKARLESLPWVRGATVVRRLPGVIYVRLVERRPLALWQHEGRTAVIDHRGAVIPGIRPEAFTDLPFLVGADAPEHARELVAMLDSAPKLRARVAAAVRVRGRRWNVRLTGDIDVRLPERDPAAAWAQLAGLQRRHGVLERDIVAIDLRLPDRLVVRTAPGANLNGRPAAPAEET